MNIVRKRKRKYDQALERITRQKPFQPFKLDVRRLLRHVADEEWRNVLDVHGIEFVLDRFPLCAKRSPFSFCDIIKAHGFVLPGNWRILGKKHLSRYILHLCDDHSDLRCLLATEFVKNVKTRNTMPPSFTNFLAHRPNIEQHLCKTARFLQTRDLEQHICYETCRVRAMKMVFLHYWNHVPVSNGLYIVRLKRDEFVCSNGKTYQFVNFADHMHNNNEHNVAFEFKVMFEPQPSIYIYPSGAMSIRVLLFLSNEILRPVLGNILFFAGFLT